jgi:hypothetical protein
MRWMVGGEHLFGNRDTSEARLSINSIVILTMDALYCSIVVAVVM